MPPRAAVAALVLVAAAMVGARPLPADPRSAQQADARAAQRSRERLVQCMPVDAALRARDETGLDESSMETIRVSHRGMALGCPVEIVQHVGAGHSASDRWAIAPLDRPATRRSQSRTPHSCCYQMTPAPGSPRG